MNFVVRGVSEVIWERMGVLPERTEREAVLIMVNTRAPGTKLTVHLSGEESSRQ